MRVFHNYTNRFVQNGLYAYFELGTAGESLQVHPIVGAGKNSTALAAIVQPVLDGWDALGLKYYHEIRDFATSYDLYLGMFQDETAGVSALTGGWMFTQKDVAANNDGIVDSLRATLDNGGYLVGHIWDAGHGIPESDWGLTATNPRFREASDFVISGLALEGNAPLAEKQAAQEKLTFVIDDGLRKAGPNGAAYVNEVSRLSFFLRSVESRIRPSGFGGCATKRR